MAETERKKPSKSRKVLVKVTKSKHAGQRDKRIRYHKTVSDDEESLMKNADLLDRQDSSETNAHSLPFPRLETLGTHGELGSKESRNNAEKSDTISKRSKLEQSTDDGELFKVDEGVLGLSEISLLENNRQCPEVIIIKSLNEVAINSDDENETDGVNSGKIRDCYPEENQSEGVTVGRIKTLQAESSNNAHDQRRASELFQRAPTSAEIATKTNTFVDRSDPRQPEQGRRVKTIKRISKKRWKRTKMCKKIDVEKEALPLSISGDRDSETIEILEMDEDDRKQTKTERRKKRRKRAKKMAKTVSSLRRPYYL